MLMLLNNYMSALSWCWPLKFSHALEIHQGLLAHMTIGVGGPLKNFKGEHLNFGLKFSVFTPIERFHTDVIFTAVLLRCRLL